MTDTQQIAVLCKDCKHSFRSISDKIYDIVFFQKSEYSYRCKKAYYEEKTELNPVLGSRVTKSGYESCAAYRSTYRECGREGAFWEPNRKELLFDYIKHLSRDTQ